jgi:hypothetical protein
MNKIVFAALVLLSSAARADDLKLSCERSSGKFPAEISVYKEGASNEFIKFYFKTDDVPGLPSITSGRVERAEADPTVWRNDKVSITINGKSFLFVIGETRCHS